MHIVTCKQCGAEFANPDRFTAENLFNDHPCSAHLEELTLEELMAQYQAGKVKNENAWVETDHPKRR